MEKSQSIKAISLALLKFHGIVGKISKDATNPFFSNEKRVAKYATLSNIQDAIRQPLQDAGLTYVQFPDGDNGLTTILMHPESGEYIQATYIMHPAPTYDKEKDKSGNVIHRSAPYVSPQGLGSAITYARRYALGAILGLNIDEDDDGNAASGKRKETDYLDEWQNELNKCKILADITAFYNSNKEKVEADPKIKALFTKRKTQLK